MEHAFELCGASLPELFGLLELSRGDNLIAPIAKVVGLIRGPPTNAHLISAIAEALISAARLPCSSRKRLIVDSAAEM